MRWWKKLFGILICLNLVIPVFRNQLNAQEEDAQVALQAFLNKDYDQAIHFYEKLIEREPNQSLFWFNLGSCRLMMEDYKGAESAYRKAIALNSTFSIPSGIYLLKVLRKQSKWIEAKNQLSIMLSQALSESLRREIETERAMLREIFEEQALARYGQKDFVYTISLLEDAPVLGFGIATMMLKGLSFLHLGYSSKAREVFQTVLTMEALLEEDQKLQQDARSFVVDIDEKKWPKEIPFWLFSEMAVGYNSNLFGDTNADQPLKGNVAVFSGGFGYQQPMSSHYWYQVSYNIVFNEVINHSSARFMDHEISFDSIWDNRIWRVHLQTGCAYNLVDTDSFLWVPKLALVMDRYLNFENFGIAYSYRRNIAGSDLYEYLEGNIHSANIHWKHVGSLISLNSFLSARYEDIKDLDLITGILPLAYISFGPEIDFTLRMTSRWKLQSYLGYVFLNYLHTSRPTENERNDRQLNWNVRLSFALNSSLDFFVSNSGTLNHSTLTDLDVKDKNYKQFILLGGLTWSILP